MMKDRRFILINNHAWTWYNDHHVVIFNEVVKRSRYDLDIIEEYNILDRIVKGKFNRAEADHLANRVRDDHVNNNRIWMIPDLLDIVLDSAIKHEQYEIAQNIDIVYEIFEEIYFTINES